MASETLPSAPYTFCRNKDNKNKTNVHLSLQVEGCHAAKGVE